jgi:pyridoxamine 5'-phosphate oxidase
MALIHPHHTLEELPQILFAELRKGSVQKKHPFRNVVFSTIKINLPSSRWVVFRKLTAENRFLIYTDARSEKVSELRENPNCGLLFYHDRQGLQIRIDGKAILHQKDELTKKYWPGVNGGSAKNYTTIAPPGSRVEDRVEGLLYLEKPDDQYFTIIEVVPSKIDVLQLDREAPVRAAFDWISNNWEGSFLVP